jgi:methionine-rich copper-binding protein CopC
VATLAVAVLVGIFGTAVAFAHTRVAATSPAAGSTAKTTIRTVKVRFTEGIRSGTLKVYGPKGGKVSAGKGGRDPRNVKRLVATLSRHLKAGRYTAKWTIVAADGHAQHGSFHFKLKK